MIGQTIGRYRVVEQIGAGGMGVVYRVFDERLQRELALKVLSPHTLKDEEARRRFRKEALILSRLSHPNIQVIHDFDTQDGTDYLVVELIPGATLEDKLLAGPLPEKEIVRLGVQLAQGLEASHQKGVLHRDLKPANLRVMPDGHLKILDFGLAVLTPTAAAITMTGSVYASDTALAGTLPYMSPEQLRGEATDARSDLYSAGAVLYEMATGRRAFAEAQVPRLTDAILHHFPPAPQVLNPKVSPELERIILKCLEKDPELRYQTAKELLVDLRRLEVSTSSQARISASSVVAATPRPRSRLFGYMGAWLAAALLLAAGLLLYPGLKKRAPSVPLQYELLTNFTDSALAPALSPDGRMVAFLRGPGKFGGSGNEGDLFIKMLPDGEPKQLTAIPRGKQTITFSPDGSRLYFTRIDEGFQWNTYEVPVLGGEPRLSLPNASGLTWIDKNHILFSEIKTGIHMGVVTASASRTEQRDVYWPATETGMAHRSWLSPDGKWVLLVEMDGFGWLPCRLVPFDGSSAGRQVGPLGGCTWAQWSPDGEWMYFSSNASGTFHLWRQAFPDGEAEQLTSGPTEEEGLAIAPDGKSIISAVGLQQSTVWIHDAQRDRQVSSQGFAFLPTLTRDGSKLYYLLRSGASRSYISGELWVADLKTGQHERVFPGLVLTHYAISPDARKVVFAMGEGKGQPGIWISDLQRSSPPRQLTSGGEYRAFFGASGEIIYQSIEEPRRLMRVKDDGSGREQLFADSILHLMSASPDGKWLTVGLAGSGASRIITIKMYPTDGGPPVNICDMCVLGFGPSRIQAPIASWSPDGKFLYLSLKYFGINSEKTLVLPLKPDSAPPALKTAGWTSEKDAASLPGARLISERDLFPGPSPSFYALTRMSAQTNLFRIHLP